MNRILRARYHQHLPEIGPGLDIAGLLQQIGAYPPGRFAEKLRDIQNSERARTET